jgi:hypothetical protein
MINEMKNLIENNDMLKNLMGNDGNSVLSAITNIMGNN